MPYKDPEVRKTWNKEYYQKNKERVKANVREYRKEYSKTDKEIKRSRIKAWKQYGIIVENYDELYDYYIMSNICEYCDIPLVEGNFGSNKKALDHDHNTGEVRGVICHTCNSRDVYAICGEPCETL